MLSYNNILYGELRNDKLIGTKSLSHQPGLIPAVLYGKSIKTVSITVNAEEVERLLLTPLKRNITIVLEIKNHGIFKTMVKDVQINIIKRNITHVDFLTIDPNKIINVKVPLSISGKNKAVIAGAKLEQIRSYLNIQTLPDDIPEKIEFDISDLSFGSTCAGKIILPKNLFLIDPPNTPILTIKTPRAEKVDPQTAQTTQTSQTTQTKPQQNSAK